MLIIKSQTVYIFQIGCLVILYCDQYIYVFIFQLFLLVSFLQSFNHVVSNWILVFKSTTEL